MAKQSKRLAKRNAERVASCRSCGIPEMQILIANLEGHGCSASIAIEQDRIPTDRVPSLPLPGCTARYCRCEWTAALPKELT